MNARNFVVERQWLASQLIGCLDGWLPEFLSGSLVEVRYNLVVDLPLSLGFGHFRRLKRAMRNKNRLHNVDGLFDDFVVDRKVLSDSVKLISRHYPRSHGQPIRYIKDLWWNRFALSPCGFPVPHLKRVCLVQTVLTFVDRVTLPRSLFHPKSRLSVQRVSRRSALLGLLRLVLPSFQFHEVDVVIALNKSLLELRCFRGTALRYELLLPPIRWQRS